MTELEQYIKATFGILEPASLKSIGSLFKLKTISKGDYLLQTGKKCDSLSFIQTGLVRIFVATEEKEITQWIATQGHFIADLSSLVFNTPARWTIQALSDSTIFTITKSDYNAIGKFVPQWHELEKLFITKCFITLEDRIFSHLSMSAEERYDFFFENNKELFNQVPLQYIASMLGMTPETFSRIRRKQLL